MLRESYDIHVEAAGRMLQGAAGANLATPELNRLAHRWIRATVARFEYTYHAGGRERTRVYHAMSGREADEILGLPVSEASGQYVGIAASRRASIEAAAGSQLAVPEPGHRLDAEVKGFRTLERDLVEGKVPARGRLRIWISQPICSSCRAMASSFETSYVIDTTIFQWRRSVGPDDVSLFRKLDQHRRLGSSTLRAWRRAGSGVTGRTGCLP
ncbi:hypothetical protein [Luteibacter aegosomatissinici]|uniref:hypothetical protein n=1 Tax=Luteibacter aegosomatissinici TaxID=2911539 RepID=UPI001FF7BB2F|nr:hypothetical protein [Luteibacter aegosomatissinici]UPG94940.1 hypothetical protein L2Y97_02195 [Luteibacter aegosomatissinici]